MVEHDVMIAMKVSMLEQLVRDLLVTHFNSTANPIVKATRYAKTRGQLKLGTRVEPDLEPIRQGVWDEFLGSVVAGVRNSQVGL